MEEQLLLKNISRLIEFKDKNNVKYIDKFNTDIFIFDYLTNESLIKLNNKLYGKFEYLEFLNVIMDEFKFNKIFNLFLIIGTYNLFNKILKINNCKNKISYSMFTNYIVEILKQNKPIKINNMIVKRPKNRYFKLKSLTKIDKLIFNGSKIISNQNDLPFNLDKLSFKTDYLSHKQTIKNCFYDENLDFIFSFDLCGNSINVFNNNLKNVKNIKPMANCKNPNNYILSIAYNKKSKQLGCVLNCHYLNFWDYPDNFNFEKQINYYKEVRSEQTLIFAVNYIDKFFTTDLNGNLYFWNLEKNVIENTIKIGSKIRKYLEISDFRVIALNTDDKNIKFVNPITNKIELEINLKKQIIGEMKYSSYLKMFIFLEGGPSFTIFKLNNTLGGLEIENMGNLHGHIGLVNNIEWIKNSYTLISCDDQSYIKLWDIKNFNCFQTIQMNNNNTVNYGMLELFNYNKLLFFGKRLTTLNLYVDKETLNTDRSYILDTKLEIKDKLIYILTSEKILMMNLENGKIEYELNNPFLSKFSGDENCNSLVSIVPIKYKRILLSGNDLNLSVFLMPFGDKINNFSLNKEINGEIDSIKYDSYNNLIIILTNNNDIHVINYEGDVLKSIINIFDDKKINIFEVSVYNNLILVGNNSNEIILINYEYGKMIASFKLDCNIKIISGDIFEGFNSVIILDNLNNLYFIKLIFNSFNQVTLELVDLSHILWDNEKPKLWKIYSKYKNNKENDWFKFYVFITTNKGNILKIDYDKKINDLIKPIKSPIFLKDYFAQRHNYEVFLDKINSIKIFYYSKLYKNDIRGSIDKFVFDLNSNKKNKKFEFKNKNISNLIPENTESISIIKQLKFENQEILTFEFYYEDDFYIIISNNNGYICIYNSNLILIAKSNINYCLPNKWDFKINGDYFRKKDIVKGVKVVKEINEKIIKNKLNYLKLDLSESIKIINDPGIFKFTQVNIEESKPIDSKINVLSDEYDIKDLIMQKYKGIFDFELKKNSLKIIEKQRNIKLSIDKNKVQNMNINNLPLFEVAEDKGNNLFDNIIREIEQKRVKKINYLKKTNDFIQKFDNLNYLDQNKNQKKVEINHITRKRNSIRVKNNLKDLKPLEKTKNYIKTINKIKNLSIKSKLGQNNKMPEKNNKIFKSQSKIKNQKFDYTKKNDFKIILAKLSFDLKKSMHKKFKFFYNK